MMPFSMYPWDEWFKSKFVVLRQGNEFTCNVHGFVAQVRSAAKKRDVRISVSVIDDYVVLEKRTKANDNKLPRNRVEILEQINSKYPTFKGAK